MNTKKKYILTLMFTKIPGQPYNTYVWRVLRMSDAVYEIFKDDRAVVERVKGNIYKVCSCSLPEIRNRYLFLRGRSYLMHFIVNLESDYGPNFIDDWLVHWSSIISYYMGPVDKQVTQLADGIETQILNWEADHVRL